MVKAKTSIPHSLESILSQERISEINEKMFLLGVTGSMHCGKSYTCKRLVAVGKGIGLHINHISHDKIRKIILANPKYEKVQEDLYGIFEEIDRHVMKSDGSINRKILMNIILDNREHFRNYNLTMYEAEIKEINIKLVEKKGIALFESALLVEGDYLPKVEYNVLLVHCHPELRKARIQRIKNRDPDMNRKKDEQQLSYELKKSSIMSGQAELGKGHLYEFEAHPEKKRIDYLRLLAEIVPDIK